jgi:hypothetical protein
MKHWFRRWLTWPLEAWRVAKAEDAVELAGELRAIAANAEPDVAADAPEPGQAEPAQPKASHIKAPKPAMRGPLPPLPKPAPEPRGPIPRPPAHGVVPPGGFDRWLPWKRR